MKIYKKDKRYDYCSSVKVINTAIHKWNRDYSDCYVGITNDVNRRMTEHNIDEEKDVFIWLQSVDADVARAIESYFLDKGCKGDTGGGSEDSCFVYCYVITGETEQG